MSSHWLIEWLTAAQSGIDSRRMPHFELSPAEARQIAGYMATLPAPELPAVTVESDLDAARMRGAELLQTVGCLACHLVNGNGTGGLWSGGRLDGVGGKRSLRWLDQWLRDPGSLNRDHKMPVMPLTDPERRDMALFLSTLKGTVEQRPEASLDDNDIAAGRKLVTELRCAACHEFPEAHHSWKPAGTLRGPQFDEEPGCIAPERSVRLGQPRYVLADEDRQALVAFLASGGRLSGANRSKRADCGSNEPAALVVMSGMAARGSRMSSAN